MAAGMVLNLVADSLSFPAALQPGAPADQQRTSTPAEETSHAARITALDVVSGDIGSHDWWACGPAFNKSQACPEQDPERLFNLQLPQNTSLMFVGPSYMNQIFTTLRLANQASALQCSHLPCRNAKAACEECEGSASEVFQTCAYANGARLTQAAQACDAMYEDIGHHNYVFCMASHTTDYMMEHITAEKEGRPVHISRLLDEDGRDMCINGGGLHEHNGTASDYLSCAQKQRSWLQAKLLADKTINVVPWHVPLGTESGSVFYTRPHVESFNCRAPSLARRGGMRNDLAEERVTDLATESHPGFNDHQCIGVWTSKQKKQAQPGAIMAIAEDLLAAVNRAGSNFL